MPLSKNNSVVGAVIQEEKLDKSTESRAKGKSIV
jgi:hypothetical protein